MSTFEEQLKQRRSTAWDWTQYPRYSPARYALSQYNRVRKFYALEESAREHARSDMVAFRGYWHEGSENEWRWYNLAIHYLRHYPLSAIYVLSWLQELRQIVKEKIDGTQRTA